MADEGKISGVISWYDLPSDLTDEEKLEVLQILLTSHMASANTEAVDMIKKWERTLSDRIAEKALLKDG
jgi:hypothetical protein